MDQLIVLRSDTFPLDSSNIQPRTRLFPPLDPALSPRNGNRMRPSRRVGVQLRITNEKRNQIQTSQSAQSVFENYRCNHVEKIFLPKPDTEFHSPLVSSVLGLLFDARAFSLDSAFHPGRRFRKDLEKKTRIRFRLWSRREKSLLETEEIAKPFHQGSVNWELFQINWVVESFCRFEAWKTLLASALTREIYTCVIEYVQ